MREAKQLLVSRRNLNTGACASNNEHSEVVPNPRSATARREVKENPLPRTRITKPFLQGFCFFGTLNIYG